ncbi:MAG: alpha/beta fold hydrolase [Crocinitomicaceae bacterium]|nr:alpha/beta fold hydrolase [Crocinitomicaceae bacterium]
MKITYREMGEGQPFIIAHGLFGFSDNWQSHANKLADYYRVILVDQRNHGHSDWSEVHTYDAMADDLYELIQELDLKNVILMGHSMGGKTVMRFAQKYTDLLDKLIVVDMGVKQYPMHHREIIDAILAIDLNVIHTRAGAEEELSKSISSFGIRQFLLKNLFWKEKKQLAWRMNIAVLEREMPEILKPLEEMEVFTPTLFIRGELSNYILDEDWNEIEDFFPDSELVSIPNAGHWVHSEAPKEFLEAVLSFCLR